MLMKVAVVEDKPLIRRAITETIDWKGMNCELVGSAGDGLEGKKIIDQMKPDIVITDIRMPDMDGLQLAAYAAEALDSCEVIVITGYQDFAYAKECVRLGVFEYILKPINNEEICAAVIKAAASLKREREAVQVNKQIYSSALRQFLSDVTSGQLQITEAKSLMQSERLAGHRFALVVLRGNYTRDNGSSKNNEAIGKERASFDALMEKDLVAGSSEVHRLHFDGSQIYIYIFSPQLFEAAIEKIMDEKTEALERLIKEYGKGKYRYEATFPIRTWEQLRPNYLDIAHKLSMYFFNLEALQSSEQVKLSILHELEQFQADLAADSIASVKERIKPYLGAISTYASGNVSVAKALVSELCMTIAKFYYRKSNQELIMERSLNELLLEVNEISNMSQAESYLQLLLEECQKLDEDAPANYSSLVKGVLRFIDDNYQKDIGLASVALQFHISSGHLSRLLRKETGASFVDIVTRTRIKAAKRLMRDSSKRIQEISELTGFKNYIYFYQVFKKYEQISPQEYKNKL